MLGQRVERLALVFEQQAVLVVAGRLEEQLAELVAVLGLLRPEQWALVERAGEEVAEAERGWVVMAMKKSAD